MQAGCSFFASSTASSSLSVPPKTMSLSSMSVASRFGRIEEGIRLPLSNKALLPVELMVWYDR